MEENKFMGIAEDIAKLVAEKDRVYGSAFELSGKIIDILFPDGVSREQYNNFLAIVRVVDKLFRIANSNGSDDMGEDPWLDIMGYALLATYSNRQSEGK